MYANQKRLLKLLGTIVAVLVILLIIVNVVKKHNAEAEQEAASSSAAANTVTDDNAQYTAMVYNNSLATLSFALDEEGNWYWADDPDFPLDQNYILKIINIITGLKPQQTITSGDALEDYGLAEPSMTLTATAENGETLTLNLGNQVSGDSGSYYLYLSGDENTIYVVANTLASQLELGIYDMMLLPELPVIPEENFSSIAVQGAAETTLSAYVDRSSQAASSEDGSAEETVSVAWRSGGADVTDNSEVQDLISTISSVSLVRCEDYAPSDEAVSICGFDAPAATVTANYLDDAGEEQTLLLLVGNLTAAEDGYYVRVNDDTTIYSMSSDSLSAILSVAESGLAA